jgi:hypothetical protein
MFENAKAWLARQCDRLCGRADQMDGGDGRWHTRRSPITREHAWPGERIGPAVFVLTYGGPEIESAGREGGAVREPPRWPGRPIGPGVFVHDRIDPEAEAG